MGKTKELKETYGLSFTKSQISRARKWASKHNVSLSAIASASVNLLCEIPLTKKELLVACSLRETLVTTPVNVVSLKALAKTSNLSLAEYIHQILGDAIADQTIYGLVRKSLAKPSAARTASL